MGSTPNEFTKGKSVNKSQLIDALSQHYEGNKKAAQHALESVLDTITREVAKGEKVAITGFGAFEKVVRPSRMVRNPQTGERKRAKKTAVPKFRPGADLKNVVSGAKKLPRLAKTTAAKTASAASSTAKKAPAKTTSTAKKAPAKTTSTAKKSTATAKKAPAKATSTAKKSSAKKAPAKATSTAKKSSAKKAPAKKASTAKRAAAKKTSTAKKAPAKKTSTAKRSTAKKTAKKS